MYLGLHVLVAWASAVTIVFAVSWARLKLVCPAKLRSELVAELQYRPIYREHRHHRPTAFFPKQYSSDQILPLPCCMRWTFVSFVFPQGLTL